MRFAVLALLACLAVPAYAQTAPQISPLTGATPAPVAGAPTPSGTAPAAHRARHPRITMQQRFDAANTTHDGKLTLDQAKAANMTRVVDNFAAIDSAKKGYVTTDDIRAYGRTQRAAKKAAAHQAT